MAGFTISDIEIFILLPVSHFMYAVSFKTDNDSGPDFACLSNFLIIATLSCLEKLFNAANARLATNGDYPKEVFQGLF